MPNDIEYHYKECQTRFHLPAFAILDKEFEVSTIEKPAFLLRNIRRKISERIDHVIQLLDPLIQPDPNSFMHVQEYRALNDSERHELISNFQELNALFLACIEAELAADEAQDAAVISKATESWPKLREALRPFIQKVASSWLKRVEHKAHVGYFG
jgi:hypothetical protein